MLIFKTTPQVLLVEPKNLPASDQEVLRRSLYTASLDISQPEARIYTNCLSFPLTALPTPLLTDQVPPHEADHPTKVPGSGVGRRDVIKRGGEAGGGAARGGGPRGAESE